MKKKILTYALSALACLTSCSDWLDINHDPNTAEKVDPGYLFNYVAVNWAGTRTGGYRGVLTVCGGKKHYLH